VPRTRFHFAGVLGQAQLGFVIAAVLFHSFAELASRRGIRTAQTALNAIGPETPGVIVEAGGVGEFHAIVFRCDSVPVLMTGKRADSDARF
jgi:hypothetical protein